LRQRPNRRRASAPLIVIQRQLGHSNLGITSVYLQGINNAEIIETVHARRAPKVPVTTSCPALPETMHLSQRGHADSALPVSRSLHEALGVLAVVNDDAEETILRRWLDDCEVQPKKVRAAAERQAQRIAERAAAQGVDLDVAGVSALMEEMYATLSDVSHIRRRAYAAW
jgi:hypothetical protein